VKKIAIALAILFSVSTTAFAQSITLRDTFFLDEGTHINYDLASWDSVFVKIMRGNVLVQYIKLAEGDSGEYTGIYKPTYTGDFVARYYAWYSGEVVREKENFSVLDTAAFFGGASGLSSADIWAYATRSLTDYAGIGLNGIVIRCKQSADSIPIAGVTIQILDSLQEATCGVRTSDSQGRGFFALDDGTHCVRLSKPGWQFTVPETLKVSGDEDTTFYADAFDPGSPPQPSLCRVYGWIYDINNQPVVGTKIEASIRDIPLRYQNIIISPYYKSTTTDDEGYWYLDLYPNSTLNPSDTKYIFFIYSPSGTILRIETTVPDLENWEFTW